MRENFFFMELKRGLRNSVSYLYIIVNISFKLFIVSSRERERDERVCVGRELSIPLPDKEIHIPVGVSGQDWPTGKGPVVHAPIRNALWVDVISQVTPAQS